MTTDRKGTEPQSYGSNKDWVEGKTNQTVDDTPQTASRHDEAFYDQRRGSDESAPHQGGKTSPLQMQEGMGATTDTARADITGTGTHNVTEDSDERKSYFRDRDYK